MFLSIVQAIVCVLLIGVVLLQMQGSGLSSSFGGGGGEFYRSRRSVEKILIIATIFLAVAFAFISLLLLLPH